MAQKTAFALIPNTQPRSYPEILNLVFGEINGSGPTTKEFREFLRMQDIFDKPTYPDLMEFIGVRVEGKTVSLGPFAVKLLEAEDTPALRRLLAERLIKLNPLMAKYCLEALDTNQDGRLHSTNEMFRLLTSYVYPGEKPTLPGFKAWIEWAVASELLKLVGVRWALGSLGEEMLPRLRAIDVEEFLEEESEQEEERTNSDDATSPTSDPAGAEPSPTAEETVDATAQVPEPAVTDISVPEPAVETPVQDLHTARDALLAWYDHYPGKRALSLVDVGINPAARAPATLYEASFAAMLLSRGMEDLAVRSVLESFRGLSVLPALSKGRFPTDVIGKAMREAPDTEFVTACEAAIHIPRLLAALESPKDLVRAEDPRELLWGLWRRMYEPASPLAPFIMARFLFETGHVGGDLANAALVPSMEVRESAFRIGFSNRMYARGFRDLLDAAADLWEWFGAPVFEGPLALCREGLGCGFRCGRVDMCPVPCREKAGRTYS